MFINSILLNNYKVYYKNNILEFEQVIDKNIFIISGHNGYGKTTFLSALVWCLYGHNMKEVDDKFKEEINRSGGYRKYLNNSLNRIARMEGDKSYSVEINLSGITFPSLPDSNIRVIRQFDTSKDEEKFEVYINGKENELSKEVGLDIFINDYLLPKEIAKFFFFDSEKIVEFAEMKSIEDRKKLSKAYSEVLGIKKYEDLKISLDNLSFRLKKEVASPKDKKELQKLEDEVKELEDNVQLLYNKITVAEEEKLIKKNSISKYIERLIREGNSNGTNELIVAKTNKNILSNKLYEIQSELKNFLDLAPFAIAYPQLSEAKKQLEKENRRKFERIDEKFIDKKLSRLKDELEKIDLITNLNPFLKETIKNQIGVAVRRQFLDSSTDKKEKSNTLLDFSQEQINSFNTLYDNIISSFAIRFKKLTENYKEVKLQYNKVVRYINEFERKENDPIVKEIREKIEKSELKIQDIDKNLIELKTEIELCKRDIISKSSTLTILAKKVKLNQENINKDIVIIRIQSELSTFILQLKELKKQAIEKSLFENLKLLMHKRNFISKVLVLISSDLVDIDLIDYRGNVISKDSLSKGEQQLYATALLKTLVEESNMKFPLFIDSPLQKFDHKHTENIINKFYPTISKQVVLFPLLEKELNRNEYKLLENRINNVFVIENIAPDASKISSINKEDLFINFYQNGSANVQVN